MQNIITYTKKRGGFAFVCQLKDSVGDCQYIHEATVTSESPTLSLDFYVCY